MTSLAHFATNRQMALRYMIIMRRLVRSISAERDNHQHQARGAMRQARKLRAGGTVFDAARIQRLELEAREHIDRAREMMELMVHWAELYMLYAPTLSAVLSLEERCDILNINAADRCRLAEVEDHGVVSLIAVLGLEDSAQHRRPARTRGPMATAIDMLMLNFLANTAQGRALADDQFEPGGLFVGDPDTESPTGGPHCTHAPRLQVVMPPSNQVH